MVRRWVGGMLCESQGDSSRTLTLSGVAARPQVMQQALQPPVPSQLPCYLPQHDAHTMSSAMTPLPSIPHAWLWRQLHRAGGRASAATVVHCRWRHTRHNASLRHHSTLSTSSTTNPPTSNRRVVVTGLGLVTPLGISVHDSWHALVNSQCGVRATDDPKIVRHNLTSKVAAAISPQHKQQIADSIPRALKPTASQFIQYALHATAEALRDADYRAETEEQKDYSGVAIGSGIGSIEDVCEAGAALYGSNSSTSDSSKPRIGAYTIPRLLVNLAAGSVSIEHGFRGPNHAVSTACTTGAHAIGDAYRFIRDGDANVMVAGGTEASVTPLAMALFSKCRALSTKFNDRASEASRPFDRDRDGFVMGEGAGILVLEEYEHAVTRNAPRIYAEIVGYGLSGDAYHITAPQPDGRGAQLCMRSALRKSGLQPSDIGYLNAHATSTPLGDAIEVKAIKSVFGQHAESKKLLVSSTKGAVGHMLGAAGSVESIFSILALHHQLIPPTLNLHNPDTAAGCDLDFVPLHARRLKSSTMRAVMSNSFGFGGTNASLIFQQPHRGYHQLSMRRHLHTSTSARNEPKQQPTNKAVPLPNFPIRNSLPSDLKSIGDWFVQAKKAQNSIYRQQYLQTIAIVGTSLLCLATGHWVLAIGPVIVFFALMPQMCRSSLPALVSVQYDAQQEHHIRRTMAHHITTQRFPALQQHLGDKLSLGDFVFEHHQVSAHATVFDGSYEDAGDSPTLGFVEGRHYLIQPVGPPADEDNPRKVTALLTVILRVLYPFYRSPSLNLTEIDPKDSKLIEIKYDAMTLHTEDGEFDIPVAPVTTSSMYNQDGQRVEMRSTPVNATAAIALNQLAAAAMMTRSRSDEARPTPTPKPAPAAVANKASQTRSYSTLARPMPREPTPMQRRSVHTSSQAAQQQSPFNNMQSPFQSGPPSPSPAAIFLMVVCGVMFLVLFGKWLVFIALVFAIAYGIKWLSRGGGGGGMSSLGRSASSQSPSASPFGFPMNQPFSPFNYRLQQQMGQQLINLVMNMARNVTQRMTGNLQQLQQSINSTISERILRDSRVNDLLGGSLKLSEPQIAAAQVMQINSQTEAQYTLVFPIEGSQDIGVVRANVTARLSPEDLQRSEPTTLNNLQYRELTLHTQSGRVIDLLRTPPQRPKPSAYKATNNDKIIDAEYVEK